MKSYLTIIALLIVLTMGCETDSQKKETAVSHKQEIAESTEELKKTVSTENWELYEGKQLGLTLNYPSNWVVTESKKTAGNAVVLNVYKKSTGRTLAGDPFHFHEPANISYLAIWPRGIGTELPTGSQTIAEQQDLPFAFPLKSDKSRIFFLENKDEWAYLLRPNPDLTNANWSEYGFVFAQTATNNFSATCFDASTGNEKPMNECDPLGGDRIQKRGAVNQQDQQILQKIIESIAFTDDFETPVTDLIQVKKPLPNMEIRSPLRIEGKATGYWFFEANFPIVLTDASGKVVAESYATADGNWMTEDFVPFKAIVEFDSANAPDDERGRLEFHRANPSGLEKNDQMYTIPVLFPSKGK